MKPLIYIELYKESTFNYANPNIERLKNEFNDVLIECDNFSDELTLSLINKVIKSDDCRVILNSSSEEAEIGLLGKTLRTAQKANSEIFLVGQHPSFKPLSRRNTEIIKHKSIDEIISLLKEA